MREDRYREGKERQERSRWRGREPRCFDIGWGLWEGGALEKAWEWKRRGGAKSSYVDLFCCTLHESQKYPAPLHKKPNLPILFCREVGH